MISRHPLIRRSSHIQASLPCFYLSASAWRAAGAHAVRRCCLSPAAMIDHGLVRWDAPVRGSGSGRGGSRRDRARRSTFASADVAGWFRCNAWNEFGLALHNACDVSGQEVMMSSQELLVRPVGKCRPTHSVIVVHVFARACLGRIGNNEMQPFSIGGMFIAGFSLLAIHAKGSAVVPTYCWNY